MRPFIRETAIAAPLPGRNLDTDQIIPARFLKHDRAEGYGRFLLHDLRFHADGSEREDFVLNRDPYRRAAILVTDENFGCGSSREGAVYALADYGVRALIGPSFGDIFYNNALKNGIVPAALPGEIVDVLRNQLERAPGAQATVDVEARRVILPDGAEHPFEIDAFWRECLLKGLDEIELTQSYLVEIESFEGTYLPASPWIAR